eukprot:gene10628-12367_t
MPHRCIALRHIGQGWPLARAELLAGGTDGEHLGVGGGVPAQVDFVDRFHQHLAVAHQDRTKRAATSGYVGLGQLHGVMQMLLIVSHGKPLVRNEA